MTDLVINGPLAERLRALAAQQKRSVEDILEQLVDRYIMHAIAALEAARVDDTEPGVTLRDEDIEVPADITDPAQQAQYRDTIRKMRPYLYADARDYWRNTLDYERLALTNGELDEQFWAIDPDGIPRLKVDQATYTLPPDPMDQFIGLLKDSGNTKTTVAAVTLPDAQLERL